MIMVDNLILMKRRFPEVLSLLNQFEDRSSLDAIPVIESKKGLPTVQIQAEGKSNFLHSKYDPYQEAVQWVDKFENEIKTYNHIFVYGIGFGYHVEELMNRFPDAEFTLYEPDFHIFYNYVSNRNLKHMPMKRVKHLFVEYIPMMSEVYLKHFVESSHAQAYLFIHPVYERVYLDKTRTFIELFKKMVHQYTKHLAINTRYERLWTINSMSNFVKVLDTPSVFHLDRSVFEKKPVVMVAAGPSLQDEFENLRFIKEHKLAYIISIGSANRALLANGILPDAVTTYDPNASNAGVFQEFFEKQIDTVPMIFGSSVGYRTLPGFKGPLLHMVTSQDTVGAYLLKDQKITEKNEILSDAPTIAVVTLELLYKLGCGRVILVGQNFGYRDNQYYSQGINYEHRPTQLSDKEQQELFDVEAADGGFVKTTETHNSGRFQMEGYLEKFEGMEVINTTRGGAKIRGTDFECLEDVIKTRLSEAAVVSNWHNRIVHYYNVDSIKQRADELQKNYNELPELLNEITKCIKKLNTLIHYQEAKQFEKVYGKLDAHVKNMHRNIFFDVIVKPMIRNEFELFQKDITQIRFETDLSGKASKVVSLFGSLIYEIYHVLESVADLYAHLNQYIVHSSRVELQEN
ncbi:motility associated factor glycosyltransferase family protein [Paenibacillus hodogayensis]|uniref:Motility associated factor glycosyltransferase family protein n=1 Tax=Paenibacillus hodogayensis TaxID=279208 RepID=A0ABV5W7C4_9BACL